MSIFKKKEKPAPEQTDEIPEKIHERMHLIYFFVKCMICAYVFIFFWGILFAAIVGDAELDSEDRPFARHEYCGTFFVELNEENSFASHEAYADYVENNRQSETLMLMQASKTAVIIGGVTGILMLMSLLVMHLIKKQPKLFDNRYVKTAWAAIALMLFSGDALTMVLIFTLIALRHGDKKTIFSGRSSVYFLVGGAFWMVYSIITDIRVFARSAERGTGLVGVFANTSYYCQLYRIAGVPIIMICAGLMLRRQEISLKKGNTAVNSKLLKGTGAMILAGTGAFVLWRLAVRVYELIKVMSGEEFSVKLPFTIMDTPFNALAELPFGMANTAQDYKNAVLFRFVKDLPVFVLSSVAVVFFVKLLLKLANGELNTPANRKYLNISMILLLAASLWFNLMGVKELDFFNNGFNNIYGEVTYTIALRSMTEPALYAMVLWFFKTYLQAIPEA